MADTPSGGSGSLDVASFMGVANQMAGSITQSLSDLTNTMTDYKAATSAEKPAIIAKNESQGEVDLIEIANKERLRSVNAEAAAMFGTNKAANSFVLAGLGDEILSGQKDIEARRADIQKSKDQSFLSDPVSWVLGQITTPFAEEALEFKEATQKQELSTARELVARTSEQFTINAAIVDGDAEGKANATRKAVLAKTTLEVAQSDQRLAALGLQEINVRSVLNRNQFDVAVAATNIQAKAIEIGLAERSAERGDETLALQKEQLGMMKQIHQLEIDAKGGSAEAKVALTSKLRNTASTLGMVAPSVEEYNRMGQREKEFWNQNMSDPSMAEDHMLAYQPGAAVQKIEERQIPLGTPGMRMTYDKLASIEAATVEDYTKQTGLNGVQWNQLPKDARVVKLNDAIKAELKREATNIPDQGGIFSPPPVASVITIPALKDLEISKVLAIQAIDPSNPLRAQDVLSAAIQQMQNGKSSPEQMADEIATIYKSVIMDNNQQRQYKRFAITPMSEAAGFKTQIQVPQYQQAVEGFTSFPVSKKQTVDMANQAQLTTLLTRVNIAIVQGNANNVEADVTNASTTTPPAGAAQSATPARRQIGTPYGASNRFDPSLNTGQQ